MMNENDSILVFEYFTASGIKEKNIISEAEELIFGLLDDLSDFKVDLVIDKSYEDRVKDFDNVSACYSRALSIEPDFTLVRDSLYQTFLFFP